MTIGRMPTRPQWSKENNRNKQAQNGNLQSAGYNILCETASDGRPFELNPLEPVRVRTEWAVTWDGGETGMNRQLSWERR